SSRKCGSKNECQLTEEHETVPKNGRIGVFLTDATAATRGGRSPRSSQPAKGLICHARQMYRRDVRFSPKSGHQLSALGRPLCAKCRHSPRHSSSARISASERDLIPPQRDPNIAR